MQIYSVFGPPRFCRVPHVAVVSQWPRGEIGLRDIVRREHFGENGTAQLLVPERQNECLCRENDADHAADEAEPNCERVQRDVPPRQRVPLDAQVEVARPNEGQHRARQAPDEAHEEGEARNRDGEEERHAHHPEAHHVAVRVHLERVRVAAWLEEAHLAVE